MIANSVSATAHVGLLVMACFVGAPQIWWQTDVNRGHSAFLILSLESPVAVSQPFVDLQLVATESEIEPVDLDEVPPRRQAESAKLNFSEVPARIEQSSPIVYETLPATASMQRAMPEVTELVKEPRQKRPVAMQSAASIAAPPPVDTTNGASFDTPPSTLPENQPPNYPTESRNDGHEGRVVLAVTVNGDGTVTKIAIATSSGFSSLDSAAIEAVHQWRFRPATLKGAPVKAEILVPVRFIITASS